MASGYEVNGVDFDDIFEPRTTTKRANVGFQINGSDISNLYEKVGSGTPASNTGYQVSGSDIGTMFAAKGSVVYWDGSLEALRTSYAESGSGVNQALVEIIFDPNGNIRLRGNYPVREQIIGTWSGDVADSSNTEIRFVVTSGSLTSNGAPTFSPITSPRVISIFVRDGDSSATVRIELRLTGDSSTQISKTVNLHAIHSSGGGIEPEIP